MIRRVEISSEKPPQWILDAVKKKWGVEWESRVIFTYGELITTYHGEMTEDFIPHEMTHVRQQAEYPGGKDAWWQRYLEDDKFRLEQELEAYRNQYQWLLKNPLVNKQERFENLKWYAVSLSGSMYGNIVSFFQAMSLISQLSTQ